MFKHTVIGQVHEIEEEDGMLVVKAGHTDDVILDTGVVCLLENGHRKSLKMILAKNVVYRIPENMKILETVLNHD